MSFNDLKKGDKVKINFDICAENGFTEFSGYDLSQGAVVSDNLLIKWCSGSEEDKKENIPAVQLKTVSTNEEICIDSKAGIPYSFVEEEIILDEEI